MNTLKSIENDSAFSSSILFVSLAMIISAIAAASISDIGEFWGIVGIYTMPKHWLFILVGFSASFILLTRLLLSMLNRIELYNFKMSIHLYWTIVIVFLLALFLSFCSNNYLLGDGLLLIDYIHNGDVTITAESFTVFLYIAVFKVVGFFFSSPSLVAFRLISFFSGLIYLVSTALLSNELFKDKCLRIVSILSFWSLGIIQLYFGYVEFYALPYSLTPLFFYYSLKFLKGDKSIFYVFSLFLLMCALHLVSASLGLSILFLLFVKNKANQLYKFRHSLAFMLTALGLLFALIVLNKLTGHVFVSFTKSTQFPYSFLSIQHLSDMLNQLILTSSCTVFLAILNFLNFQIDKSEVQHTKTFRRLAAMCALTTALFSLIIDPKLGAFRDWDLKAFFAIPLHVFVLSLVPANYSIRKFAKQLTISIIPIFLVFTFPWLYYNHLPLEKSLGTTFSILKKDIHYTPSYDSGERMKSLAVILTDSKVKGYLEATELLTAHLSKNPNDDQSLHLLALANMKQGYFEEAYRLQVNYLKRDPRNAKYLVQTAQVALLAGRFEEALYYLKVLRPSDTSLPIVQGYRAQANYGLGRINEAEIQFFNALKGNVKDQEVLNLYSDLLFSRGQVDSSEIVRQRIKELDRIEVQFK